MIVSGNEARDRNVFRRWRKVDRDRAEIILSGSFKIKIWNAGKLRFVHIVT